MYGNVVCSESSVAGGLLVAIVSYSFLCMVLGSLLMFGNCRFSSSIGCIV